MKYFKPIGLGIAMSLAFSCTFAMPKKLVTHNKTDVQSNAFIGGEIASKYPTEANSERTVYWGMVRLICSAYKPGKQCPAVIKMKTNTANPVEIGAVTLDLDTGKITPSRISNNGYTFVVNGIIGDSVDATITKD